MTSQTPGIRSAPAGGEAPGVAQSDGWYQRLARATGLLYLIVVVFGMFSAVVLETLVVPGDATATAQNVLGSLALFRVSLMGWLLIVVADVAISVLLFSLLESINRTLSLVAASFRIVYSAMLGAFLLSLFDGLLVLTGAERAARPMMTDVPSQALYHFETFSAGFTLALVFFGVHMIVLGVVLFQSRYVPRVLGVLLTLAGIGYILDGLGTFFGARPGSLATAILLGPALFGEVGLTLWLLVKGVDVRPKATTPT